MIPFFLVIYKVWNGQMVNMVIDSNLPIELAMDKCEITWPQSENDIDNRSRNNNWLL